MSRSHRAFVATLLALALLAAQALGLAHRVAHGLGAHGAPAASAHDGPITFDTHEPGSPECRLIDHATHLDVLVAAAAAAMPPRVPHLRPRVGGASARTGSVWAYLARAPPGGAGEGRGTLG